MAVPLKKSDNITLSIRNLSKTFKGRDEKVIALDDVSLDVREGELFTLLGPSGCGKTTTLRCIAGFDKPTSGKIHFLGRDYTAIPPFRRNIGMVFQSYSLFPHLSIYENVAYGLKTRKLPRREIEEKVDSILRMVGLEATRHRKSSELSGGQQQRIALARVTTIYVTHDQEEALSISDRIAVMHAGKASQVGIPDEIYEDPNSIRVAAFIGQANFLECRVKKQAIGSLVLTFASAEKIILKGISNRLWDFPHPEGVLFLRPNHMEIFPRPGKANTLRGKLKFILYLGSVVRHFIEVFQGRAPQELLVDTDRRIKGVYEREEVALGFHADDIRLFPPDQKDQLQKE